MNWKILLGKKVSMWGIKSNLVNFYLNHLNLQKQNVVTKTHCLEMWFGDGTFWQEHSSFSWFIVRICTFTVFFSGNFSDVLSNGTNIRKLLGAAEWNLGKRWAIGLSWKKKKGPFETFKKDTDLNFGSAIGIKFIGKNNFLLFFL